MQEKGPGRRCGRPAGRTRRRAELGHGDGKDKEFSCPGILTPERLGRCHPLSGSWWGPVPGGPSRAAGLGRSARPQPPLLPGHSASPSWNFVTVAKGPHHFTRRVWLALRPGRLGGHAGWALSRRVRRRGPPGPSWGSLCSRPAPFPLCRRCCLPRPHRRSGREGWAGPVQLGRSPVGGSLGPRAGRAGGLAWLCKARTAVPRASYSPLQIIPRGLFQAPFLFLLLPINMNPTTRSYFNRLPHKRMFALGRDGPTVTQTSTCQHAFMD